MNAIKLKNYKLIEKIGWGGMGVVYIAEDLALGRLVALKFLAPYLMQDPEIMRRFRAEARSQARLMHQNITMVYAFRETDDQAFLVLEYVDGETLEKRLKRLGRIPAAETVSIFEKVLNAIYYAHSKGVIHRDIKPSNIGFTTDGIVKVMDFGIALNIEEANRLTQTGHPMGTPHYMAPEQILGRQSDHRADIYALGIMLYETLTGRLPFDGASDYEIRVAQINQSPPSPRSFGHPDITPALEEVILKAIAKGQNERFADVKVFLRALKAAVEGGYLLETNTATRIGASLQPFQLMDSLPAGQEKGRGFSKWFVGRSFLIYGALAATTLAVLIVLLYQGFRARSPHPPAQSISSPNQERPVAKATPSSPEKKPAVASPGNGTFPDSGRAPGAGAGPQTAPVAPAPTISPSFPESALPPEKRQVTAVLTPPGQQEIKPPTIKPPAFISPAAVKARLVKNDFPDIKVSLDEKNKLIITGRINNPAQKKRVIQLVDSMGLPGQVDYSGLTVPKEKPVKVKRARKKPSTPHIDSAPVSEETRTPLPPKLD
jgi:serine/threonine protein kinase